MGMLYGDWKQEYLMTSAYVLADTCVLTFFLRAILKKDHIGKLLMLALSISLLTILSVEDLLKERESQVSEVQLTVFFFLAASQIYLLGLGSIALVVVAVERLINSPEMKGEVNEKKNQVIIIFNFVFAGFITISYLTIFDIAEIIKQNHFWLCVGITATSAILLGVGDWATAHMTAAEAVKRKIFHVGPIIIIPLVFYLNPRLLPLIIAPAFSLLLLLEVVRYHQQLMDEEETEGYVWLRWILGWLNIFYNWMGKFNKREKHFWFTHLFLALSLLAAYLLPSIISPKMKLPGHIVLVLIGADGLAAFCGQRFGRIKIYGSKTLEGTAAFVVSCLIGSYFLVPLNLTQISLLSVAAGVAELFGGDTDNMITLLAYYGLRLCFVLLAKARIF